MRTFNSRKDDPVSATDNLPYVEAELRYFVPMPERPSYHYHDEGLVEPAAAAHKVRIHDMRPLGSEVDLDRQGFALVEQCSSVGDFYDDDEVRRVYYPEVERFVAAVTGARRVYVYDHVRRRRPQDVTGAGLARQPVTRVHADRSGGSVGSSFVWRSMRSTRLQRLRELFGEDADEILRGRVQVLTLWRPIRGPVLDLPLAACDARTIDPGDLVPSDLVYEDRVAAGYSVTFNPAHRWYYAPEMQTHEALLLKCSDTKREGCAQFALHAAFTDPTTPPSAPPRESIELRMLVFRPA